MVHGESNVKLMVKPVVLVWSLGKSYEFEVGEKPVTAHSVIGNNGDCNLAV
jgi:hypothetical protein